MAGTAVTAVKSEEAFASAVRVCAAERKLLVVFFWVDWHDASKPGGQMDVVVNTLAQTHHDGNASVQFIKVNADSDDTVDIADRFTITVTPTFLFIIAGKTVQRLEGADPRSLSERVAYWSKQATKGNTSSSVAHRSGEDLGSDAEGKQSSALRKRLERLVLSHRIMVFMKGSPAKPFCKWSKKLAKLFNEEGIVWGGFDVFSDDEVRQGIKDFSGWQTFPQVFANGRLVGGYDVIEELREEGTLKVSGRYAVPLFAL